MDNVPNVPRNVSNLKSVALTILELLAFNTSTVWLSAWFAVRGHTDAQSDENIISGNSLRSLGGD